VEDAPTTKADLVIAGARCGAEAVPA
jgi:hypothetical protein